MVPWQRSLQNLSATGVRFCGATQVTSAAMIFGHNTNVKLGDLVFHVQTEDRGEFHTLIDTTVYYHGRVLHRRTNNYLDLLPLNDDRREALRLRLEDQHITVIEEIRSGVLQLPAPKTRSESSGGFIPPPCEDMSNPHASVHRKLLLELTNPKSWLAGKHVNLLLTVREEDGEPANGAHIRVEIEGSENHVPLQTESSAMGQAQLEFEMPKITRPNAALVIHAENHSAKGQLRFALRAKPRVA